MFEIVKAISVLAEQVKAQQVSIGEEQSCTDKLINDLYHIIEYLPLSAPQMSQVSKRLKETLIKRRALKEQFNVNQAMLQTPVEKLKGAEESEKRVLHRDRQYFAESKAAFDRIFKK